MADFFATYEAASEGNKLSREVWNGGKWVVAPETIGNRRDIDSLTLLENGSTVPWERRMEDMAEDDWTVLP